MFVARATSSASGTVLDMDVTSCDGMSKSGTSSFSWGDGCTPVYDASGKWLAVVSLDVAV